MTMSMTTTAEPAHKATGQVAPARSMSLGRELAQLYRKDLGQLVFTLVLFSVLILAWEVFLFTRIGHWPEGVPFGLSFIPLGFIPLWTVWDAISSYRSEWHNGTVYLMLSLPTAGWKQAASKLAAVMTSFTLQCLLTLGGVWFVMMGEARISEDTLSVLRTIPRHWLASTGLQAGLALWLFGLGLVVLVQAAYVVSRLAQRWQFVAMLGALFAGGWITVRLGGLGHYLFGWVPRLSLTGLAGSPGNFHIVRNAAYVDTGVLIGWGLAGLLFFGLTIWLLQHVVEV
ncbi:MAG: hypothetical protein IMX01_01385 [Limnochordaceae bacterium]|nr:hypothetical protein [Limnochordaceae bacterium]